MKKLFTILLLVAVVFTMTACGDAEEKDIPSGDEPAAADPVISLKELYGMYVSAADESMSFEFTPEEITLDENNLFVTSPVYKCQEGEDKVPVGAYSLEIEGNILTVVDWHGGVVPFEIVKDGENITLKFLADQFEFSLFETPGINAFLSDLTKVA